jgi:hypothetical protein
MAEEIEEIDCSDLIDEFKERGQIPLVWQWTAREFVCAANILRQKCADTELFAPGSPSGSSLWKPRKAIRLLYGLALENLLKGLLVAQGVDATSTGQLNAQLKTHNLVKLWKMTSLPMSDPTEHILRNLQWSIEVGKYPVGTRVDPQAPTLFLIEIMTARDVVQLIETAEDALRALRPDCTLEKRNLLELCAERQLA